MTTDDINEISSEIWRVLEDRCQTGWAIDVTQHEVYDDMARVSVVFENASYRLEVKFRAFINAEHPLGAVKFMTHDDDDIGEEVSDLLWQWLFWEMIKRAGKLSDQLAAKTRALAEVEREAREFARRADDEITDLRRMLAEREAECKRLRVYASDQNAQAEGWKRTANELYSGSSPVSPSEEAGRKLMREHMRQRDEMKQERDSLRAQLAAKDAEIERLAGSQRQSSDEELIQSLSKKLSAARQVAERDERFALNGWQLPDYITKLQEERTEAVARANHVPGLSAALDEARSRLAECEPVVEAVREMQDDPSDAQRIVRALSMKLPEKRTP